jgi:vacuolar-type H+-ATPase subunit E/Vma4
MGGETGSAGFDGPASVIDAQVEAMLQRVTEDRDRRCTQLRADVSGQARAILRGAHKEARAAVADAVARERKHGEQVLRQTQANALLEQRQHDQQEIRHLLQDMWRAVASALESRWADPPRRKSWAQAAIRQALTLLSAPAWRIEHGGGLPQEELAEWATLASAADRSVAREVEMAGDDGIRAGIRIRAGGACLDATTTGLLASRTEVESDFLAQYLAQAPAPSERLMDKPT